MRLSLDTTIYAHMMRHCKPRSRPTQAGRALRALHMQQQAHLMATAQLLSSLVTQRATLKSNRCLCCGEAAVACEVSGCSRRPKAVLLPSQHGFCDTSLVAAPLQGQVRAAASTAREPQQQHAQCRKGLALLPFASRPRHTPGTYHAVCLDHRGRPPNHASRRATGAVYQRALGQARQSPP